MPWPETLSFNVAPFFAPDYQIARAKFRTACARHGVEIQSFAHPAQDPHGQDLSVDAALFGPSKSEKLIVVVSGTHGLEGLAGSGCQLGWIEDGGPAGLPPGVAMLLVHTLNPWGCAWDRRQTEDNIDLNRNFVDFSEPLPENINYGLIQGALNCPDWDGQSRTAAQADIVNFRSERGERAFASALFQGQYIDPDGIGFGGAAPAWSNTTLHTILKRFADKAKTVALIDLHSGYGPFGWGTLLTTMDTDQPGLKMAQDWYGDSLIALKAAPEGVPYDLVGDLGAGVCAALPDSTVVTAVIEFGTYDVAQLLKLQIEDRWLQNHGDRDTALGQRIRSDLVRFFYPHTHDWCQMLHARAQQVIGQAMAGLA